MLLGEHGFRCAHDILDAGVADVEREPLAVQQREHVGMELFHHTRPQLLGAGNQQVIVGRHCQQPVKRGRDVAQVRLYVFVARALVAGLGPAALILAAVDVVAEGKRLMKLLGRAPQDTRETLVHESDAHVPHRPELGQWRDERSVRDHERADRRMGQSQHP